jgi:ankyrin repeat protein
MVKTLIEYGCDIHDLGDGRGTPLTWALQGRHDDVVRVLCQHGADLGAEEERLGMAVMIGPKQIVYVIGQQEGSAPSP